MACKFFTKGVLTYSAECAVHTGAAVLGRRLQRLMNLRAYWRTLLLPKGARVMIAHECFISQRRLYSF